MNLKKVTYGLSLTAFLSYALAVFLFFSGNVFQVEAKTFEINKEKKVVLENLKSLRVMTTSTDIKLKVTDVEEITVKFKGTVKASEDFKEPKLIVEKNNDVLTVKIKRHRKKKFIFINYNYSSDLELIILFPNKLNKMLSVSTVSGDIECGNIDFEQVETATTSGDFDFNRIVARKLDLETVSGDIKGEVAKADEFFVESTSGDVSIDNIETVSFVCSTVSGDYTFKDIKVKNVMKISSTSGDFELGKVIAGKFKGGTISGEVEFATLTTKLTSLETVSGDIVIGNFVGDLNVSTTSGCVKAVVKSFDNALNVSTTSGDIDFKMHLKDKFSFYAKSKGGIEYSYNGQSIDSEHKLRLNCSSCTKTVSLTSVSGEISLK
jgi:DUF4097 and DUF4098 domain-containing protein YvlB